MLKDTALSRLAENESASLTQRMWALQNIDRPKLAMLRRLIAQTKTLRKKPVPPRLMALASMRYAQELELRRLRKREKTQETKFSDNPLGI